MAYRAVESMLAEFGLMGDSILYTPIAWGQVLNYDGKSLLVGERYQPDDPLRAGQLNLPGGKMSLSDKGNPLVTAQRETLEETDVDTVPRIPNAFTNIHRSTVLKPRENVVAAIEPCGTVWVHYTDSCKSYVGRVFDLAPLPPNRPRQKELETRNPHYMPVGDAIEGAVRFTPASRVVLEMVAAEKGWRDFVKGSDVLIEPGDLGRFLCVAEPEPV